VKLLSKQQRARLINALLLISIRLLSGICSLIPICWSWRAGRCIGALAGKFLKRERAICCAQLDFAYPKALPRTSLGKSQHRFSRHDSIEQITTDVFRHVGESVAELFIINKLLQLEEGQSPFRGKPLGPQPPRFKYFTSDGEDILYEFANRGQGAVGLSGHIGCFELLAAYHVRCGVPLSVLGRTPNYSSLDDWLKKLRSSYGIQTLWRNERESVKKLLTASKDGRLIAALIDQDVNLENGFSPFFGLKASNPITPIRLAIKFKLPIVSSFIVRTKPLHHHIITESIPYSGKGPDTVQAVLDIYSQRLEKLISEYPDQWIWWHRRWRRRPEIDYTAEPDKLRSTRDYLSWLSSEMRPNESSLLSDKKRENGYINRD